MEREQVVAGVSDWTTWWLEQRRHKVNELSHEAMAINPFLLPLVTAIHGYSSADELAKYQVAGHLSAGHATGFGKLVDEKILPEVFGVSKLSAAYRRDNNLQAAMYDEVDHRIPRADGGLGDLLSLKAGRWTIQLAMARSLNQAFGELLDARDAGEAHFDRIVLGVMYGTESDLTDKFRIVRGIEEGKEHGTRDIREHVDVYCGEDFWAWINDGETETQTWVLEGILDGIADEAGDLAVSAQALKAYEQAYAQTLGVDDDGQVEWYELLKKING